MKRKIKNRIAIIIYLIILIASFIPLIFWLFNPELTAMQIFIQFKWLYFPILVIWFIYIILGIKNKKS